LLKSAARFTVFQQGLIDLPMSGCQDCGLRSNVGKWPNSDYQTIEISIKSDTYFQMKSELLQLIWACVLLGLYCCLIRTLLAADRLANARTFRFGA
jgi:hypothetical protein